MSDSPKVGEASGRGHVFFNFYIAGSYFRLRYARPAWYLELQCEKHVFGFVVANWWLAPDKQGEFILFSVGYTKGNSYVIVFNFQFALVIQSRKLIEKLRGGDEGGK